MINSWMKGALGFCILISGSITYASERGASAEALEREVARLERALVTHPKEGALQRTELRRALSAARADLAQARSEEKRPE